MMQTQVVRSNHCTKNMEKQEMHSTSRPFIKKVSSKMLKPLLNEMFLNELRAPVDLKLVLCNFSLLKAYNSVYINGIEFVHIKIFYTKHCRINLTISII